MFIKLISLWSCGLTFVSDVSVSKQRMTALNMTFVVEK